MLHIWNGSVLVCLVLLIDWWTKFISIWLSFNRTSLLLCWSFVEFLLFSSLRSPIVEVTLLLMRHCNGSTSKSSFCSLLYTNISFDHNPLLLLVLTSTTRISVTCRMFTGFGIMILTGQTILLGFFFHSSSGAWNLFSPTWHICVQSTLIHSEIYSY